MSTQTADRLTTRAGHPLTDYCLFATSPEYWGQDASQADADRYNEELRRLVSEEFGIPCRLVTVRPPHSTLCREIEGWLVDHWQDAVIDAPTSDLAARDRAIGE